MSRTRNVTLLLNRWARGDKQAADEIFAALYDDLRRLAQSIFAGERGNHTLSATALLHEVYLDLAEPTGLAFGTRLDFYSLAACLMRRALVDHARKKGADKRGGGAVRVPIEESLDASVPRPEALLALDAALRELEAREPRLARVVELRYFAGLTVDEIAGLSGTSARTVARQWSAARRALYLSLRPSDASAA